MALLSYKFVLKCSESLNANKRVIILHSTSPSSLMHRDKLLQGSIFVVVTIAIKNIPHLKELATFLSILVVHRFNNLWPLYALKIIMFLLIP